MEKFEKVSEELQTLNDNSLSEVSKLATQLAEAQEKVEQIQDVLNVWKGVVREISENSLPDAMSELNLTQLTLKNGSVVSIKYLTGKDANTVASAGDTPAVQNTELVTMSGVCDDERSLQVRREWAKSLSLADRKNIVRAVLDDQPGPRLEEVNAPCAYCSEDITMVLDWVSLLLG